MARVEAFDPDQLGTHNSPIVYSLESQRRVDTSDVPGGNTAQSPSSSFAVDQRSGVVTMIGSGPPGARYRLAVTASDRARPTLSSSTALNVVVVGSSDVDGLALLGGLPSWQQQQRRSTSLVTPSAGR